MRGRLTRCLRCWCYCCTLCRVRRRGSVGRGRAVRTSYLGGWWQCRRQCLLISGAATHRHVIRTRPPFAQNCLHVQRLLQLAVRVQLAQRGQRRQHGIFGRGLIQLRPRQVEAQRPCCINQRIFIAVRAGVCVRAVRIEQRLIAAPHRLVPHYVRLGPGTNQIHVVRCRLAVVRQRQHPTILRVGQRERHFLLTARFVVPRIEYVGGFFTQHLAVRPASQ